MPAGAPRIQQLAEFLAARARLPTVTDLQTGTVVRDDRIGSVRSPGPERRLGMKRVEINRKFDEIVDFSEIEKFLDTPVKHYSSGMYMRLAFAVAAHLEPEILVVDEVLAVGDAAFQRKCLDKMQDVGQQGRTVLFVSHNMAAITRLCQRALLLAAGRVVQGGLAHEVVGNYLNAGTATMASREWPDLALAPGDDWVRLCAVRVYDGKAKTITDTIDIRNPIQIEIEYYNFANPRFPHANVQLFDENGTCLFAAGDYTNPEWRHQTRQFTGKVRSRCTIPGNFLSEGQFRVLAALTTHNPTDVLLVERDAVSFTVVDKHEGDGARSGYAGHLPGVIRPLLEWVVVKE